MYLAIGAGSIPVLFLINDDVPAHAQFAARFGVAAFPTLRLFRGGEPIAEYKGPRSARAMLG